jgi:hypothetical protein
VTRLGTRSTFLCSLTHALALGWLLSACDSDSVDPVEEPQVTGIVVAPEDFLGAIPCVNATGAMRLYTAELVRVTLPEPLPVDIELGPERLQSQPLSCERGVAFGHVTIGATYAANISAYDRADLVASSSGDGTLVDPQTNELVMPRWTGVCGCFTADETPGVPPACEPSRATRAEYQSLRHVYGCSLTDHSPTPSPTQVTVTLDPASAELQCGGEAGMVSSFAVYRDGELLGEAGCAETLSFDAEADEVFELEVLAYTDGDSPALGTVCRARALSGATIAASCDPLSARGGLEIPLASAVAALGASCADPLRNLSITLDDEAMSSLELTTVSCAGSLRFDNLAPGEVQVSFTAERGDEPLSGLCSATVEPGLVARPTCDQ